MPQNPQDVTNPGLVNVADEGDGLLSIDQPVTVGPSSNPGIIIQGISPVVGLRPLSTYQTGTVTPAMTAQTTVQGGTNSPQSPSTENVTPNNVAGQVYGQGTPQNVFV